MNTESVPTPAMPATDTETTTTVEYRTLSAEDLEKPYRVILENDDVTPMDIVTIVLMNVFELSVDQAINTMMEAHVTGHAVVGVMPYAEAHEKVYAAHSIAREYGYPLTLFMEPDA